MVDKDCGFNYSALRLRLPIGCREATGVDIALDLQVIL